MTKQSEEQSLSAPMWCNGGQLKSPRRPPDWVVEPLLHTLFAFVQAESSSFSLILHTCHLVPCPVFHLHEESLGHENLRRLQRERQSLPIVRIQGLVCWRSTTTAPLTNCTRCRADLLHVHRPIRHKMHLTPAAADMCSMPRR